MSGNPDPIVPDQKDVPVYWIANCCNALKITDEGISFSVWDNLEDLDAYESSETHQAFAKEVEHLYQGDYWVKTIEFTKTLPANRGVGSEREPVQLTVAH